MVQNCRQGDRVGQLMRQALGVMDAGQCLVRIAQVPQHLAHHNETPYLDAGKVSAGLGGERLGCIAGHALLEVGVGQGKLAKSGQGKAEGKVRVLQAGGVGLAFGQA